VATSQARDAANGQEFFDRVSKETGFRFQVISGDDEAKYTFLGALLPGMSPERSAVIDIGGGSTELIGLGGGQSVDVGSVRFTERYLKSDPVTDGEFWACQAEIDRMLSVLAPWRDRLGDGVELVAVAGTATTLAAYHLGLAKFDARAIDQLVMTRGDIHRMVEELKWRSVDERMKLPGMEPGRADVLLAGSLILWRAMELLRFPECRVSTRGLRFGVLKAGLKAPK
jgi:exopolyphosphatase/guanosine-5'-triphosphate,3'-diphosphate pyrophosphatase